MNFFKKTEGTISIFLCIILVAMIVFTGLMVDGSRIRAGESQVQFAVENATLSTLANYDNIVKDLYGIFVLAEGDPQALEEEVEHYLNSTLMTELGIDKKTMGEEAFGYLKGLFTGGGEFKDVDFLNMYDYRVEDVNVTPLYNLSESEVLKTQIVEYMKYRAPKKLFDTFIDKLLSFKNFGKQSDVMKKKVSLDKGLNKIKKEQEKLAGKIALINGFEMGPEIHVAYAEDRIEEVPVRHWIRSSVNHVAMRIMYEQQLEEEEKIRDEKKAKVDELEPKVSEYEEKISDIKGDILALELKGALVPLSAEDETKKSDLQSQLGTLETEFEPIKTEYDTYEGEYKASKEKCEDIQDQIDEQIKYSKSDRDSANKQLDKYIKYHEEALAIIKNMEDAATTASNTINDINNNDLKDDSSDFANSMRVETSKKSEMLSTQKMDDIKNKINSNLSILNNFKTEFASYDPNSITKKNLEVIDAETVKKKEVPKIEALIWINSDFDKMIAIFKNYNGNYTKSDGPGPIIYEYASCEPTEEEKKAEEGNDTSGMGEDRANEFKEEQEKAKEEAEAAADEAKKDIKTDDLPSKNKKTEDLTTLYNKDKEYVANIFKQMLSASSGGGGAAGGTEFGYDSDKMNELLNDVEFSKDDEAGFSEGGLGLLSDLGSQIPDIAKDGLEAIRDNLFVNEYVMDTFKNQLTDYGIKETDADYENKAERDLRGNIKDKDTYFNKAEVEYILTGDLNEGKNKYAVQGQILLIRFGLNTIHIFLEPGKNARALQIATALFGWTGFGVPIAHVLIMLGWAMAESILDVNTIMEGKKVPLFKTLDTWVLSETGMFNKVAETVLNEAVDKAVNNTIDIGVAKVNDLAESVTSRIEDLVNTKIALAIDNCFAPVENAINGVEHSATEAYDNIASKMTDIIPDNENMNELQRIIVDKVKVLAEDKVKELENRLITEPVGEVVKDIKGVKDSIKEDLYIDQELNNIKQTIVEDITSKLNELGDKAKEKASETIEKAFGSNSGGGVKNDIKSTLLSLGYHDYLRIFLFVKDNETKLGRIADLIQLNMRTKGYENFTLSDHSSYLRVEAEVSMKYIFMTQPFIPDKYKMEDGKRHKYKVVIYKGY